VVAQVISIRLPAAGLMAPSWLVAAAFEAPPLLAGCLNRLEAEAGKQRLTNWFIGLDAWQIVKTLAPMSFFKLGTQ
jgi:hypothetical protein